MFVPAQGFRHAAALLLARSARAIPAGASSEAVGRALEHLANDLVALADDTRAPARASDWLIAEFKTTIDQLPQAFDRETAKAAGAAILAGVASRTPSVEARDLFLVYVPEDRLRIAAPLAIELIKRRVSVALAEYEVATEQQLSAAIAHGLENHRGGVLLWTRAFERAAWRPHIPDNDRFRILWQPESPSAVPDLTEWANRLRVRNLAT